MHTILSIVLGSQDIFTPLGQTPLHNFYYIVMTIPWPHVEESMVLN